jgi:hypothetical protein
MNVSQRSGRLAFACVFLAALLLVGTSGCNKEKAKLVARSASGSLSVPNTLAIALVVINDGEATAEDVQASSISLAGATLTDPTLPEILGDIPKGDSTTLAAAFTSASLQPGGIYTIHVEGTFRENGHKFKFALAEPLQIPPVATGSSKSLSSPSPAQTVTGAPYPAQPPNLTEDVNDGANAWTVPNGPDRPAQPPSSQSVAQPAPQGDPPQVDFENNTPLGFNSHEEPNEPSGAVSSDGIVFETANSYGSYSTNGQHFTRLNPTTIFPNNLDGGFCCDQIVEYVSSIDRFIWVMQFHKGSNGLNRYRIAAASPATLKSSGGKSWTYWDITSTQVGGGTGWLDYPDASVGNNYLYVSADVVIKHGGRVVIRIPLSEIKSASTINFGYTHYPDGRMAYGGHLAQNAQDEIFWAGQKDSSTLRVFQWPESSTDYNWTDVAIGKWPNKASFPKGLSSTTPDTNPKRHDWLKKLSGFPGSAVLGATRLVSGSDRNRQNQVLFAWSACKGMSFPQPHVQWVALDRNNNFKLISQQQIWSASVAYAYPAFAINSNNDIGMSLEFGGGGNYENHVAGFWGDYVLYITTSSNEGTDRYGDYVTIRPYAPDQKRFVAFGYGMNTTGFDTRYIVFSRPKQ